MNYTATLTKILLALGVILAIATVGLWLNYWAFTPTQGAMAAALLTTFLALVAFTGGIGLEELAGGA